MKKIRGLETPFLPHLLPSLPSVAVALSPKAEGEEGFMSPSIPRPQSFLEGSQAGAPGSSHVKGCLASPHAGTSQAHWLAFLHISPPAGRMLPPAVSLALPGHQSRQSLRVMATGQPDPGNSSAETPSLPALSWRQLTLTSTSIKPGHSCSLQMVAVNSGVMGLTLKILVCD